MTNRTSLGSTGENIAAQYLKSLGWSIIERNYRRPWGEIDIIAREPDKTLVFVEVKTMNSGGELMPEDNMSRAKIKKIARAASLYAGTSDLIHNERGWRIDLIAISLDRGQTKENIRHYRNIH